MVLYRKWFYPKFFTLFYCLLRRVAFVGLALLGLHFFVICLFCSQLASLLGFNLSFRVIKLWALQSPQVPFSYRHAFLHFFWMVFVDSHVVWLPFFNVNVRERMLVFESHSDHAPFPYLHSSRFLAPRSLLISTSWSSSSHISPSATARVINTTASTHNANHFISLNGRRR
jgi:hypothetical protein